jgi:ribonuclease P protein component
MIGIVVNRKTDPRAAKRNFWKRRVREIFQKHQAELRREAVCLVKVRPMQTRPSFKAMEEELIMLFKKAGAWA